MIAPSTLGQDPASDLPRGWSWKRISWLFEVTGSGTTPAPEDIVEPDDTTIPWVTTGELREVPISTTTKAVRPEAIKSYSALKVHPTGSLLIAMYGATIGRMAILAVAAASNQACCALSCPKDTDVRFVFYGLQAGRPRLLLDASGGGQPNINQDKVRSFKLQVPPLSEQRAIADFLDRETARIDTLIEEQQRLVDLLRERRASVVDMALTRHGLHIPHAFEDYGSHLPTGWKLILLGRTLRQLTNGFVGPTRDILVETGIRYIQGTHIKSGRIEFDRRPFFVSQDWHELRPRIHLREGDVLIVQTGDIGKVAVVPPDFGEASCHALQIARTDRNIVSGEYLAAFLSSRIGYQSLVA